MNKKKRKIIITISVLLPIILIFITSFAIYFSIDYDANIDSSLLESNEIVTVDNNDDYIAFIPNEYSKGLIFYQGAKVEEEAYVPMMRKLAEEGILCVIAKAFCNFALFNIDGADDIIDDFNKDINWYISGHSLGGAMASNYASDNKNKIDGVILFAAYSTENIKDLRVLSIYGSNDKVLNIDKYNKSKKNYPSDFKEVIIEGGNHAYFGSYGEQKGDGKATISREEQIQISVDVVSDFVLENE